MRLCDPTINSLLPCHCWIGSAISAVVGVVGTLISAGSQAAAAQSQAQYQNQAAQAAAQAQQQQAANAQAIANYNASISRQNADVAYKLASYQAAANVDLSQVNQAAALRNAQLADMQRQGAQKAYDQQLANAKQQEMEAAAVRAQTLEQASRTRDENAKALSNIRARYGGSGVTFEGSPVAVLGDAAAIGELAVQDMVYAGELEGRKQIREAEITKFEAQYSLIDAFGFQVQGMNARAQARRFAYEGELYAYDSAIAGVQKQIGYNQARLQELSGSAEAQGYQFQAQQSILEGQAAIAAGSYAPAAALGTAISGISTAAYQYGAASGKFKATTPTPTTGNYYY